MILHWHSVSVKGAHKTFSPWLPMLHTGQTTDTLKMWKNCEQFTTFTFLKKRELPGQLVEIKIACAFIL